MAEVFSHRDDSQLPGHKRRAEVEYSFIQIEVTEDGEKGIEILIDENWKLEGGTHHMSRTAAIHLEEEQALKLAYSIYRKYGRTGK